MVRTPTIVDIANKMGISPISVSRAMRNAGHVSKSLRKRILQEARRIGYQPNPAARALRSNSSYLVGLILPSFFSYQINEFITNIQHFAQLHDHGVILGLTQWSANAEIKQLEFMASKKVDGIIIKSRGYPQVVKKMQHLVENGVKIICLLDKYQCDAFSIMVDNINGGTLAAKYLIENGHKNVCYVTYKSVQSMRYSDTHFSDERFNGMKNEYLRQNIPLDENNVIYVDTHPDAPFSIKAFEVLLDRIKDFTAVFAYDDYIAAGISNLLQQKGVNVPSDCSIIGFDDSPLVSYWSSPPITVIKQPDDVIASEAINLIMGEKSHSKAYSVSGNIRTIKPKLVIRESVKKIS